MKTKYLLLSALAVIIINAASVSNLFTSERPATLKCYEDISYKVTEDSTDGYNGGGPKNPPTGN